MGKNGLSATDIGLPHGLNARQTNKMLEILGLVEKSEHAGYVLTDAGKEIGHYVDYDNGYGGHAYRGWSGTYFDPERVANLPINEDLIQQTKDAYAADLLAARLARATSPADAAAGAREVQADVTQQTSGAPVNWGHVAIALGSVVVVVSGVLVVKRYGPDIARVWEKHATPRIDAVRKRLIRPPVELAADDEDRDTPEE